MADFLYRLVDKFYLEQDEYWSRITTENFSHIRKGYIVTTYGKIYDEINKTYIKFTPTTSGYLNAFLELDTGSKICRLVHRIVMIVFKPIDNMDIYDVNHLNGNKQDNRLCNLEWCTRSENLIHAYKTVLHHPGEDHYKSYITNELALEIYNKLLKGYTISDLSKYYNLPYYIIKNIKRDDRWKCIKNNDNIMPKRTSKLSDEDVKNLCQYFCDNPAPSIGNGRIEYYALAAKYIGLEINNSNIERIRFIHNRKNFTNISKNYTF